MIYKEQENKWYKDQIDRIESLKKEHVETKEILSSISETLEKDVLLPINSVAFVRAQIYHTNETMINLGNDYFVERSVHQASQIVQRRIDVLDDGIKKLRDEFEEKKDLGVTMQMDDGTLEIIEPFEEDFQEKPAPKPVEKKAVGESILKKKEPVVETKEVKPVQKAEPQTVKFEEEVKQSRPEPIKEVEKKQVTPKVEDDKKKVSFSQEVETKEIPKKVSKFKQDMMDRRKN